MIRFTLPLIVIAFSAFAHAEYVGVETEAKISFFAPTSIKPAKMISGIYSLPVSCVKNLGAAVQRDEEIGALRESLVIWAPDEPIFASKKDLEDFDGNYQNNFANLLKDESGGSLAVQNADANVARGIYYRKAKESERATVIEFVVLGESAKGDYLGLVVQSNAKDVKIGAVAKVKVHLDTTAIDILEAEDGAKVETFTPQFSDQRIREFRNCTAYTDND